MVLRRTAVDPTSETLSGRMCDLERAGGLLVLVPCFVFAFGIEVEGHAWLECCQGNGP